MQIIQLKAHDWDIAISPESGASIIQCQFQGRDIFRPAASQNSGLYNPVRTGHFPLVPVSNRIAPAQFIFDGQTYTYPSNHPNHAFAVHGEGWITGWEVSRNDKQSCELVLDYTPRDNGWPFAFRAVHGIKVNGPHLTLSLSVTNTGPTACPAGAGLHPFFPQAETAHFQFEAQHIWLPNAQALPITRLPCHKSIDAANGLRPSDHILNSAFSGWDGNTKIWWDDRDDVLTVKASNAPNLIVYTPKGESFFCLEPVTHINNAIHIAAENTPDGMSHLNPGQTLSINATFSISKATL